MDVFFSPTVASARVGQRSRLGHPGVGIGVWDIITSPNAKVRTFGEVMFHTLALIRWGRVAVKNLVEITFCQDINVTLDGK